MSSGEDPLVTENSGSLRSIKKRRVQRACDYCRRKKVRCDGNQTRNHKCSGCTTLGVECTYIEEPSNSAPSNAHVQDLEAKLGRAKKLIRQLCTDDAAYNALVAIIDGTAQSLPESSHPDTSIINSENEQPPTLLDSIASSIRDGWHSTFDEDEDERLACELSERVNDLHLEHFTHHFGKSNATILMQRTIEVGNTHNRTHLTSIEPMLRSFKSDLGTLRDWEKIPHLSTPTTPLDFPDDNLLRNLVILYFENVNLHLPLLHRPTFTRCYEDGLHLRDTGFAIVLLLVCAVGSRYTDDPRTRLVGEDQRSAGWKWFRQAVGIQRTSLLPHSLYDLQYYPLAVHFLSTSATPHACWILLGIGLRIAQDMGIHRRGLPKPFSVEDELKKRCFWIMIVLDRYLASHIGRPCTVHDEDIDLELPIDCDDEFWEHEDSALQFVQPPGRPSKITGFIWLINLIRILAVTLRTIYATNKSKCVDKFAGNQWETTIVAELDSSLNRWRESLPQHLRWNPDREEDDFVSQAIVLHGYFYYTQIFIHRPYLPTPSRPSRLPFPSLALCTSAARSCSHLIDLGRLRARCKTPPWLIHGPMATAALILLLNIASHKRSAHSQDMVKSDMKDVQQCIATLWACQRVCFLAGCSGDIMQWLADSFSLSEDASRKRQRESDDVSLNDLKSTSPSSLSSTNSIEQRDLAQEDQQMQFNEGGSSIARDFTFDPSNPYTIGSGATVPVTQNSSVTQPPLLDPTLEDFSAFFALSESLPGFSMQDFSKTFSMDSSVVPPTSLFTDPSVNAVQPTHPAQEAATHLSLGQENFSATSTWPTTAPATSDRFPADFNLGLESDLMNINSWSDSPASILFQGFAPYFADIAQMTLHSEEQ